MILWYIAIADDRNADSAQSALADGGGYDVI